MNVGRQKVPVVMDALLITTAESRAVLSEKSPSCSVRPETCWTRGSFMSTSAGATSARPLPPNQRQQQHDRRRPARRAWARASSAARASATAASIRAGADA